MFFKKKNYQLSERLRYGVSNGVSKNKILKISGALCLILSVILGINSVKLIYSNDSEKGEVLGVVDVSNLKPEFIEYTIEKGDTLFNLSQKYNISWVTLANLNNLKSPFTLKPGQKIQIPKQ